MSSRKLASLEIDEILTIFQENFINYYRIIFELDQKAADLFKAKNTHYFHLKHQNSNSDHSKSQNCCSQYYSEICIPTSEMTKLEILVKERLSRWKLIYDLPNILNSLAATFYKIQKNGKKDSLKWNDETEKYVLNEVLKEGVLRQLVSIVKAEITHEQNVDAKQPLLLATPISWKEKYPKFELNNLHPSTLLDLKNFGMALQKGFLDFPGFLEGLMKELEFLERDSRFEECIQDAHIRTDKVLWLSLSDIPDNEFRFLYKALLKLCSLPFEFNAKANLSVQTSESFQISFFKNEGFHNKHIDSSYEKKNENGKKFSLIFVVNKFEKSNLSVFKLSKEDKAAEEKLASKKLVPGSLFILNSRDIPYSINTTGKGFLIRYWINGPQ